MNFFRTITKSVYGPLFYAGLPAQRLKTSIWYFVGLSAIVAAITSALFIPNIFGFLSPATLNIGYDAYPDELEMNVTDGVLATNVEEPYFVPVPFEAKQETDEIDNIFVIDTQSVFSPSQLQEYSTAVLLKREFMAAEDNNGQYKIFSYKELGNLTVTEEVVRGWGQKIAPYLVPVAIAVSVLFVLLMLVVNLFTLVYLFIAAGLVYLLLKVLKRNFSYKDSYKAALHAATLPMILSALLFTFGMHLPFLTYTLIVLLIVVVNLKFRTPEAVSEPV